MNCALCPVRRYVVVCDPVGAKIGNGGATMHVLEQLQAEIGPEQLLQGEFGRGRPCFHSFLYVH